MYVVHGGTLTTFNVTDVGEIRLSRPEDPLPLMGRENDGGITYSNGRLYVSTERGLEVYDLTGAVNGGVGPVFVTRIPGLHYRRLTASGDLLAGLFPMNDIPCSPMVQGNCRNAIDIIFIGDPANPFRVGQVTSINNFFAFEDIAFANGFLYATGDRGTIALSLA